MQRLMLRVAAASIAGAAALLAVASLGAQIEDLSALFGLVPSDSDYQRVAAAAAAACGELGAERESCEMSLMRLGTPGRYAGAGTALGGG